jgi:hypothetical protein
MTFRELFRPIENRFYLRHDSRDVSAHRPTLIEDYEQARAEFHIHVGLGLGEGEPSEFCAVFEPVPPQERRGVGHGRLRGRVCPPEGVARLGAEGKQGAVFVDVLKVTELPDGRVSKLPIPSAVRLMGGDECERLRAEAEYGFPGIREASLSGFAVADRKLQVSGLRIGMGESLARKIRRRQSENHIVKAGAQVVETVARNEAAAFQEPFTYDRVVDVVRAIRIEFASDSVTIDVGGVADPAFKGTKVFSCPPEPQPNPKQTHGRLSLHGLLSPRTRYARAAK